MGSGRLVRWVFAPNCIEQAARAAGRRAGIRGRRGELVGRVGTRGTGNGGCRVHEQEDMLVAVMEEEELREPAEARGWDLAPNVMWLLDATEGGRWACTSSTVVRSASTSPRALAAT